MSRLAIDPSGHVVACPTATLKPGWRWADDVPAVAPVPVIELAAESTPAPVFFPRVSARAMRRAAKIVDALAAQPPPVPPDDEGKDPA